MKRKVATNLVVIWFAMHALFMLLWPIYLYLSTGYVIPEMVTMGCVIMACSVLVKSKNQKLRRGSFAILGIYSIGFAILGIASILVASPKVWLAYVLTVIVVVNLVLLGYRMSL